VYSSHFKWLERARAWDGEHSERMAEASFEVTKDLARQHVEALALVRRLATDRISRAIAAGEDLGLKDACQLLFSVVALERSILGIRPPGEGEPGDDDRAAEASAKALSTEELRALVYGTTLEPLHATP
jgi:hypothetical protein